jgi:hypothetical protein
MPLRTAARTSARSRSPPMMLLRGDSKSGAMPSGTSIELRSNFG